MSLILENMTLQVHSKTPGSLSIVSAISASISSPDAATVDVELAFPRHPVDLCYDIALTEQLRDLGQGIRHRFNFKVAGNRAVYLLWIDDGRIFFDDPLFLKRLYAHFYSDAGNADLFTDFGIGHAGILDQKPDDFPVQLVKTVQKHGMHLLLDRISLIISCFFEKIKKYAVFA